MAFELSSEGIEYVKKELGRYETKYSAIIPALYRVQSESGGWVPPESISQLSQIMDIPSSHINEVFKFYTMFNKEPVGKYHVQVCCNVSCAMNGGRELADFLCEKFNVKEGEVSSNGRYTVTRVECLGACDKAPMMQVNEKYCEGLTQESALKILEEME